MSGSGNLAALLATMEPQGKDGAADIGSGCRQDAEIFRVEREVGKRIAVKRARESRKRFAQDPAQPAARGDQATVFAAETFHEREVRFRHPQHVAQPDALGTFGEGKAA